MPFAMMVSSCSRERSVGLGDGLHLLVERLQGVPRDVPRGLDALVLEELEHPGDALAPRGDAAGEVRTGVLTAVRAEPASDAVYVDADCYVYVSHVHLSHHAVVYNVYRSVHRSSRAVGPERPSPRSRPVPGPLAPSRDASETAANVDAKGGF
jgi:hypothetical protein